MRDLTKSKLGQISRQIEAAQAAFRAEVERIAEQARAEMLPYFQERDLDFHAGNGTWYISRLSADDDEFYRAEHHVSDDDLPKNLRELLKLEAERGQCLGFYVRDIEREE